MGHALYVSFCFCVEVLGENPFAKQKKVRDLSAEGTQFPNPLFLRTANATFGCARITRACGIFFVLSSKNPLDAVRQSSGTFANAIRFLEEISKKSFRNRYLSLGIVCWEIYDCEILALSFRMTEVGFSTEILIYKKHPGLSM